MNGTVRWLVCAAISAAAHLYFVHGLERRRAEPPRAKEIVRVRLVAPPPPPPPPPAPEPPPPQVVHEPPRPHAAVRTRATPTPAPVPTEKPAPVPPASDTPVFGVTMQSTSQAGTVAAPVGNTLQTEPDGHAAAAHPAPLAPAPAYDVTRMPLPEGRCSGKYTDEARAAGVEGTVVLDLVVGADGTTGDITVVQGLSHGLTEAAVAALKECRFKPGERDGQPVAVRVRGFKIDFFMKGE